MSHDAIDLDDLAALFTSEEWHGETTAHMPWFRLADREAVRDFVEHAERQWQSGERARYLVRENEDDTPVGTASFDPDWDRRCGGSDVVLVKRYWGQGYGTERASAFVELTFEHYDLAAYVTSCAVDNEESRRMIERIVERYGGRFEGVLRQFGAPHPDGTVTDQRRYSITREEYEAATSDVDTPTVAVKW